MTSIAEQKTIFETIKERKDTPASEYVSYDDAMKITELKTPSAALPPAASCS